MNAKRLILAMLAVFLAIWITDFLIHGIWLLGTYKETASLWRTEEDMSNHMGWMLLGQLLTAVTFVTVWAAGFAARNHLRCAVYYGLFMGLFRESTTPIYYAVQPMPGALMAQWFLAGLVQAVLLGLLVFLVYKPRPDTAPAAKSSAG